jgi:hypothetical protein
MRIKVFAIRYGPTGGSFLFPQDGGRLPSHKAMHPYIEDSQEGIPSSCVCGAVALHRGKRQEVGCGVAEAIRGDGRQLHLRREASLSSAAYHISSRTWARA